MRSSPCQDNGCSSVCFAVAASNEKEQLETNMEPGIRRPRLASPPDTGAAAENPFPLSIVGLSADPLLHGLALSVLSGIARNCEAVCQFQSDWWTFEHLTMPAERELASKAVADADMIWCAAYADRPLPEAVTALVERCLPRSPEGECALVALLSCPPGYVVEQSPSWNSLRRLARQAGSEFFTQCFTQDGSLAADASQFADPSSVWLPPENDPVRGQIRWGINE